MLFSLKNNIISIFLLILFVMIFSNDSQAEIDNKQSFPSIWNVPNANEYFVGRKEAIGNIYNNFRQKKKTISLIGSSGIGKTQLAKRYVELYKHNYDIVWWIDSDKNKNIGEQFKKLAIELNNLIKNQDLKINTFLSNEEIVKQVKENFRITGLNWLIVFDSAIDKDKVKDYLPEKHNNNGNGHILITSTNPLAWNNIMELEKFTREESIELLTKITNKNDLKAADQLAETLKDFPLAIVQAATYIRSNNSITIKEYIDLFFTNREKLWREENHSVLHHAAFDNYQFTVYTTLSLIIKEIEKESHESVQLLAFCSFLNHKNIPKVFLKQYLTDIGVTEILDQEKIISNLIKYSLIQLHETKGDYTVEHLSKDFTDGLHITFTIHEISQLAIQDYLNKKQKQTYLQNGLVTTIKIFPDKLTTFIPLIETTNFLLPHIQSLTTQALKLGIYNKNLVMLEIRELEYFLSGKRNFSRSNEVIKIIEENLLKIPEDNLVLIRFGLMRSVYYAWHDFDYNSALMETQKVHKLLDKLDGVHDEEYLMVYNRLIQFYGFAGDRKNALRYTQAGEDLIKNSKEFLGNQDVFYHSLAKIYMDDEQFDKAYYYSRKAIDNKAMVPGLIMIGDFSLHILASEILIRKNDIDLAYNETSTMYESAKEIWKKSDDLWMANTLILYGYSNFLKKNSSNGKYEGDIKLIQTGQDMLKRLLGERYLKNRNAAVGHVFLGDVYEKVGLNIKALAEYSQAEHMLDSFYHSKQLTSSDVSDLYAKLAILNLKMLEPLTAQVYLTKLQKNFGYKNPKTIKVTDHFIEHGLPVGF